MRVWTVTVFENGDMTTSVWGVFDSEKKANTYADSVRNDETMNSDYYYTAVSVGSHEVE